MRKVLLMSVILAGLSAMPAQALWVSGDVSATDKTKFGSYGNMSTKVYKIMFGNDIFTVGYKTTDYDFSHYSPIDKLHLLFGDIHYEGSINTTVGYFVGTQASLGWEDEFHASDNYSLSPRAGLSFVINEDFSIQAGVCGNINEAKSVVLPILALRYRDPSDLGFSAVIGSENAARYRFNEYVAAEASLAIKNQEIYQLKDDSVLAHKGYLVEESSNAKLGLIVTPLTAFNIRAGVSVDFDRDYKIYNHSGDKIRTIDTDSNVGGYLNCDYNF